MPIRSNRVFVDGPGLRELISASARAVEANQSQINTLNVFPVPDGDTGTNMSSTLNTIVEEIWKISNTDLESIATAMARYALLGARGNSGLILAQFFKGLSLGVANSKTFGGLELASSLREGASSAYGAVETPTEGTMLTVMREVAEIAEVAVAKSQDLDYVLVAVCEQARDCVARTPTMLEILKKAGVVDAGGYGFAVVLEGALAYIRDCSDGSISIPVPLPQGVKLLTGKIGVPRAEFVEAATDVVYGYCTTFIIEGEGLDSAKIRSEVTCMGESAVVAGDREQVKVHVHPLNPGPVLTYASDLGMLAGILILNMDEQTEQWTKSYKKELNVPETGVALVAVASGAGMTEIFIREGMGASTVVSGGDAMNPSVEELLEAVELSPSLDVIILPNNKNILGTAREAARMANKNVEVLPIETMQEGVSALLAFSVDKSLDANMLAMTEAAGGVRVAAVTHASRPINFKDLLVHEGDIIGLLDGEIVCCGDDVTKVTVDLIRRAAIEGDLVSIYRGKGVAQSDASNIVATLRDSLVGFDVEVIDGGQPHYVYLVAIE